MRPLRLLQGILVAALVVAGLAGRPTPSPAADWSKIRVGTEGAYAPFNYVDSAGQLRGLDIDIVQALCARIGATCEFVTMQQEGLVLGGSTGINVCGAIRLARDLGPGHTIVTILADSGTRYQSKLFNPEFLKSRDLPTPPWL